MQQYFFGYCVTACIAIHEALLTHSTLVLILWQDVDVPDETEISFAAVVAFGTLICCVSISCLGLCIKCATWIFGHRGTRRLSRHLSRSSTTDTGDARQEPYVFLESGTDRIVHPGEIELGMSATQVSLPESFEGDPPVVARAVDRHLENRGDDNKKDRV